MTPLDTLALFAFAIGALHPLAYILANIIAMPILVWREHKWKKILERKPR